MTPSSSDSDILMLRRELRRTTISAREALTVTAHAALNTRLEAHLAELLETLAPMTVAFCWPFRGEPDLRRLMGRWTHADAARTAALPVVLEREHPLAFRPWVPGMALVADRHGIPHPPAGDTVVPDVVLVPLNAFDARGYRLGYGGGYFDRTLASLPALAIGVGFELGRSDSVYPQAHDQPMDWIVTEAGAFQARNSR
ncbi:MAG TPA: 5-formyltetrahydrofolate cyclo-ligase [Rhodocyclaceae bacterium]|nr:5-formyltetrahydrofolate cyclo-ligase [Rhodocyclaceae bacterium]